MRILAFVDGSPASLQAARYGAELARATSGTMVLAHAHPEASSTHSHDPVLAAALTAVRSLHASVKEKSLIGSAADAIPRELRAHQYDLVTIGSRGRGESGAQTRFLGSSALDVVREALAPVLLVRATERDSPVGDDAAPRIRSLLVPTDGSPASVDAAGLAAGIARASGAEVTILRVLAEDEEAGVGSLNIIEATRAPLQQQGVKALSAHITGDPRSAILEFARQVQTDMILMGTYGAGEAWHRKLMGSVAEKVLIGAPCPVVLVKRVRE